MQQQQQQQPSKIVFNRTLATNIFQQGDFAPVKKEHDRVLLDTRNLQMPKDFPLGLYVRNGPNCASDKVSDHMHWFEGEAMLTGVHFEKRAATASGAAGAAASASAAEEADVELRFTNKWVVTETFKRAKAGWRRYSVFNELRGGWALAHLLAYRLPTGIPVLGGLLSSWFPNATALPYGGKDLANTAVIKHNGRCFALVESGPPTEFREHDLSTVGVDTFSDSCVYPLAAHSKVCPTTGQLISVGYSAELVPHTGITLLPPSGGGDAAAGGGATTARGKLALRYLGVNTERVHMQHDFAVSARHVLVLAGCCVFDQKNILKAPLGPEIVTGTGATGQSIYNYDPALPSFVGIIDRAHLDKHAAPVPAAMGPQQPASIPLAPVRWFRVSGPCMVFHVGNAYESATDPTTGAALEITLTVIRHNEMDMDLELHHVRSQHRHTAVGGRVWKYVFRLSDATPTTEAPTKLKEGGAGVVGVPLEDRPLCVEVGEFPTINNAFLGRKHRFIYAGVHNFDGSSGALTDERTKRNGFAVVGLMKIDLSGSGGVCAQLRLAPDEEGDEFVFVARRGGSGAEDDGFLCGYVYNSTRGGSDLCILDARDLRVLTRVPLPQRVPHGFHGQFFDGQSK